MSKRRTVVRISVIVILSIFIWLFFRPKSIQSKIDSLMIDGDTALYSFVENRLSNATKDSLCRLDGEVVFDLNLSIRDSSIEEVDCLGGYIFYWDGSLKTGFNEFRELDRILKDVTFNQFPQYSDSLYGNYGIKLELSKICD